MTKKEKIASTASQSERMARCVSEIVAVLIRALEDNADINLTQCASAESGGIQPDTLYF
jgi:hypothetical protein